MDDQIKKLVDEGKEYCRLKRAYEMARFPEAGTPAYVVSIAWLDKYKQFIFYNELSANLTIRPRDDHIAESHPGPITNADVLEASPKFLKGTGTVPGFETNITDTYLANNARERQHFEFVNEEMWNFLKARYEVDHEIKRLYVNKGTYDVQVSIDARLKLIPIVFVRADDLYAGKLTAENFEIAYVQISARKSFSEFKKRLVDVAIANQLGGADCKKEQLRVWLTSNKEELLQAFA